MKITIDALPLCGQAGGRSYLHSLTRHLFALDTENDYTLIYRTFGSLPAPAGTTFTGLRSRRIMVPNRILEGLWTFRSLRLPLTDWIFGSPDVYFSTIYFSPVFSRAATVTAVYDITTMRYDGYRSERANFDVRMRNAISRSRFLVAISEFTKKDLCGYYNVAPEKVVVTPLAADPSFRPSEDNVAQAAVLRRYDLEPGYILYVGNIGMHKNVAGLLESYALLRKSRKNCPQLVLCGKTRWGGAALAKIGELGLEHCVRVLDYVPDGDLPFVYRGAALFVYISVYEGFGLPVLEAMQSGIPVITSDTTSLPEVAGNAGLLVNPLDPGAVAAAMRRLLEDDKLAGECRRRGLERAADFSWDRTARATLDVLRMAAL